MEDTFMMFEHCEEFYEDPETFHLVLQESYNSVNVEEIEEEAA